MAQMIGDIFLLLCIICAAVVFIIANVRYLPEDKEDE